LIKEGNYTESKLERYDAGSVAYYCYKFDKSSNSYKCILLDESGDWKTSNKDKNAIQIANWLKKLDVFHNFFE
jgi:hypothetical protein